MFRLEPGEEVVSTLTRRLGREGIGFGFISAAGGVRRAKLGYWNARTRKYEHSVFDEQVEVLVMQGNCSVQDGKPHLHLHAVLGREDFTTIGGHVVEAEVYPTLELWLRTEDSTVERVEDKATGLAVLGLEAAS
jgi:uncharacterized protein